MNIEKNKFIEFMSNNYKLGIQEITIANNGTLYELLKEHIKLYDLPKTTISNSGDYISHTITYCIFGIYIHIKYI